MRYLYTVIFSMVFVLGAFSQALTIDTTFKPFIDFRCCGAFAGNILDIWEEPKSGDLFIVGSFHFATANKENHGGVTSMHKDGSRNFQFKGISSGGGALNYMRYVYQKKNNIISIAFNGNFIDLSYSGEVLNDNWRSNFYSTRICCNTVIPYFYPNGFSLVSNGLGNPGSCRIHTPTDTFPHQYLLRFDSLGRWDSTFKHETNYDAQYFIPYDSNRIFVQGLPRYLTEYDGVKINGLCRIYLDGTLDTTFKLVLADDYGHVRPIHVQEDGSFFLHGASYALENYPNQLFDLAKFHADGSLDTSFKTNHNLIDTTGRPVEISSIVATPDNGYIITGQFDSIQGYRKHKLAKLDSLGNLEPQYFTSHGPDTAKRFRPGISKGHPFVKIKKSAFGGYYAFGNFISWDGKPVQPIVRLKELTVGIDEPKINQLRANIYPNPSKGEVQLVAKARLQSISVYNLQGQKVQEINPQKRSWELPKENGMYFIRLEDKEGNYYSKKIIKTNK